MKWTIEKLHGYKETICSVLRQDEHESCKGCNQTNNEIDNCYNEAVE